MTARSLIPKSALEHHIAVLGKTGSGKTATAKSAIVEPELAAGGRVAVIDPTGAWWGLRLDADGKSKGLPIYVFGGDHGDFPLGAGQGEMMAEAIGSTNTPVILDTKLLKTGERMRFFTEFADAILRTNKGPLRLVIDEAHLFAPQAGTRGAGAMPDMLHAANNLISLGRSCGLRIVLISQRPAKLHKDSLTQVETLIAMRLIAPQDRKAIEEWIADQADKETGKDIIASLPSLKAGEAWCWSPEAHFLKRVQFPMPSTYDSSKPQGSGRTAKRLSPIDVEQLQEKFAKVKTEAEAKDPKILQRRITELEQQLRKSQSAGEMAPSQTQLAAARRVGFADGEVTGYRRGLHECAGAYGAFTKILGMIQAPLERAIADTEKRHGTVIEQITKSGQQSVKQAAVDAPKREPDASPGNARKSPSAPAGGGDLPSLGAERRPLAALAAVHPAGMTEAQWAVAAGLKRKGGTWSTYLSRLRTAACIERRGDEYFATDIALHTLGDTVPAMPPPGPELVTFWKSKLNGVGPMLDVLAGHYPNAITRDELAEELGLAAGGGTFSTYISRLRSPGLVEVNGREIRLATAVMG